VSGKVPTAFADGAPTRDGYGAGLVKAGKKNAKVVALDADLAESTRSKWFGDLFPDRFFQMGIAEQDMVTTAAGLASAGLVPFASTFAIFTERAFEQVRNAVARPNLNVKIVGSHGGLMTGEDGSSAHAIEDVAIYRALPNMTIVVPGDATECMKATEALAEHAGPAYLKLTRAKVPKLFDDAYDFRLGRAATLRDGSDITIVANGALLGEAVAAADLLKKENVSVRVLGMATVKPLDGDALLAAAKETGRIVTAEDHSVIGGLGSAVCEFLSEHRPTPVKRVGVRDLYAVSGTPKELYEKYQLSAPHLAGVVREALKG